MYKPFLFIFLAAFVATTAHATSYHPFPVGIPDEGRAFFRAGNPIIPPPLPAAAGGVLPLAARMLLPAAPGQAESASSSFRKHIACTVVGGTLSACFLFITYMGNLVHPRHTYAGTFTAYYGDPLGYLIPNLIIFGSSYAAVIAQALANQGLKKLPGSFSTPRSLSEEVLLLGTGAKMLTLSYTTLNVALSSSAPPFLLASSQPNFSFTSDPFLLGDFVLRLGASALLTSSGAYTLFIGIRAVAYGGGYLLYRMAPNRFKPI